MAQSPVQTTYTDALSLPVAGQIADAFLQPTIVPALNNEASTSIPFGWGVARDTATAATAPQGLGAKLPAATSDKFMGITVFSQAYSLNPNNLELDTVGMKPGVLMSVMRQGRIWAAPELGCTVGNSLFVRCTSAGAGKGSLLAADPGSNTVIATTGKVGEWQGTSSSGVLTILEVDALNA